jgi:hypothetical protein
LDVARLRIDSGAVLATPLDENFNPRYDVLEVVGAGFDFERNIWADRPVFGVLLSSQSVDASLADPGCIGCPSPLAWPDLEACG